MNSAVSWALNRAKEPSTWAGLTGLAVVFSVSAEQWQMIGNAVLLSRLASPCLSTRRSELTIGHHSRQPTVWGTDGSFP